MSLSCLAFFMLSCAPNVLVSIVVSSVICGSFTVDAIAISAYLLSLFISVAGVCVYLLLLIIHADLDYFSNPC